MIGIIYVMVLTDSTCDDFLAKLTDFLVHFFPGVNERKYSGTLSGDDAK